MAVWLAHDTYDGPTSDQKDDKTISVTSLLKSTREIIITRRIAQSEGGYTEDISGLLASRLGQALHSGIEQAWLHNFKESMGLLNYPKKLIDSIEVNPEVPDPNKIQVYLEQRASRKVGEWVVTGQYDIVMNGQVQDVKSTSTYAYTSGVNDSQYVMQGSIYRWLNPELITDDVMTIQYLFKDWSKVQAISNPNYPALPVVEKPFALKDINEADSFVKSKLSEIDLYIDAPEPELPYCTKEELWQKDSVWKYYGKLDAKRATKVFDNVHDANLYMSQKNGAGIVIEVKGEPVKCGFCNAAAHCSQFASMMSDGTSPN